MSLANPNPAAAHQPKFTRPSTAPQRGSKKHVRKSELERLPMFLNTFLLSLTSSSGGGGGDNKKRSTSSNTTTPTEADVEITEQLRARGVLAADQLNGAKRELIREWIAWYDLQTGAGPGVLVEGIRSGKLPPAIVTPASVIDRQREYQQAIREWLTAHLPDVCRTDSKVVEHVRRLWGDAEAKRLEGCPEPHNAAFAVAVGRGWHGRMLRVGVHGPEIRAAVKAAVARELAEFERMEAKQDRDRQNERPHLVAVEAGGDGQ